MDNLYLKSLEELNYANLDKEKEDKLREVERNFNNEFDTDYYFMVMKRK